MVLVVPLKEAFGLFEPEEVLLLLYTFDISPFEVAFYLVDDVIYPRHFLQPINCTNLLYVFLIKRLNGLPIDDVLFLALIDELQFLKFLLGEGKQILAEISLLDGAFLLLLVILLPHFFDDLVVLLLLLRTDLAHQFG